MQPQLEAAAKPQALKRKSLASSADLTQAALAKIDRFENFKRDHPEFQEQLINKWAQRASAAQNRASRQTWQQAPAESAEDFESRLEAERLEQHSKRLSLVLASVGLKRSRHAFARTQVLKRSSTTRQLCTQNFDQADGRW